MRSVTNATDTALTSSRPAAFFSKVTTPFTSRKRNFTDFYIVTDEPYRKYSPGDVVKGFVNIKFLQAVNITHLTVCLHGFVKVFSSNAKVPSQSVPYDGASLGMGGGIGKRGAEYFGNGFASLFEDEVVVCGQGRLDPRPYRFEFEIELPSKGLPTSVDFERGTISYMLTATLTKPTTISPKSSCHRKIKVVEGIDVAWSQQPKPQTISLEPLFKGSRGKGGAKRIMPVSGLQGVRSLPESTTLRTSGDLPRSPAPSETSSTSGASSGGFEWQIPSSVSVPKSISGQNAVNDCSVASGISATIVILRGGCLPGDILPVQVSVSHVKAIKSLQGIIITLYRLGRVDTHPAIPLGPKTKDKKSEYEDYYPKSRTGLGGLSLSSAGSSRTFQQDLNQTFAPLIVDPRSLTAVVKTSVQVPEDVFPTITNVPGEMISFKYYVEVVVDLRGKLASQDRVRSQLGIVNGAGGYGRGDPQVNGVDGSSGLVFPLASGFGCLDTRQIRREKSVVSWPFEVIVGTRDSDRKRVKLGEDLPTPNTTTARQPASSTDHMRVHIDPNIQESVESAVSTPHRLEPDGYFEIPRHLVSSPQYTEALHPIDIFPPPRDDSEGEDEKGRLRRAEQRLLPSEPPTDYQGPSTLVQPSAPQALNNEDFIDRYRMRQPASEAYPPAQWETTVHGPIHGVLATSGSGSANSSTVSVVSDAIDDKQELEMRRLQGEASSPTVPEGIFNALEPTAPASDCGLPSEPQDAPSTITVVSNGELLPTYSR